MRFKRKVGSFGDGEIWWTYRALDIERAIVMGILLQFFPLISAAGRNGFEKSAQ